MLVGVPPYTPDTLIEVTIEGDRVWLRFADVFARPLHLTPEQGLALVAGRACRACRAATARARWPPRWPSWRPCWASTRPTRCRWRWARPAPTCSTPCAGRWPTAAGSASTTTPTAATSAPPATSTPTPSSPTRAPGTSGDYHPRPGASACSGSTGWSTCTLLDESSQRPGPSTTRRARCARRSRRADGLGHARPRPAARWVVETYPVDEVSELDGGWLRVRLAVAATPWLERLLVRSGTPGRSGGRRPAAGRGDGPGRRSAASWPATRGRVHRADPVRVPDAEPALASIHPCATVSPPLPPWRRPRATHRRAPRHRRRQRPRLGRHRSPAAGSGSSDVPRARGRRRRRRGRRPRPRPTATPPGEGRGGLAPHDLRVGGRHRGAASLIALVIEAFLVQAFWIPSPSMVPPSTWATGCWSTSCPTAPTT